MTEEQKNRRRAGVLLPVSALPGAFGIGTLGEGAYHWVDFLARAGQRVWQMLPVGPTGYQNSPYQSPSAFAGNPLFIDPALLCARGLLTEAEAEAARAPEEDAVLYGALIPERMALLHTAAGRMDGGEADYRAFCESEKPWLEEYAGYMTLWESLGQAPVCAWPASLRQREPSAFSAFLEQNAQTAERWRRIQFLFHTQWMRLKAYASERDVELFGDLPIYVSADSADLWAEPELFLVDETLRLTELAGCPPDGFSETGQLWGNPLYDWDYHAQSGFSWWLRRLRRAGTLYDMVRIDHFRGLEQYYAVPADAENAVNGVWRPGPGEALLKAVKEHLPELSVVAENLGYLTPEVYELQEKSGWPGMLVTQFAFDGNPRNPYLPHNHMPNAVAYTGTHDNPTTAQWAQECAWQRELMEAYTGASGAERDAARTLIRLTLSSVARLAVVPVQDWLGLGAEARVNVPGVAEGNWRFRLRGALLNDGLASWMRAETERYAR